MPKKTYATPRKNVAVIGGGASGVATAMALLSLDPNVNVSLYEKGNKLGGMATSVWTKDGKQQYNNGVQGVHRAFVFTRHVVESTGLQLNPTSLSANFVHSGLRNSWSNLEGTTAFRQDLKRFERLCRSAQKNRIRYALITIVTACRLYRISRAFVDQALVPTLALFFGTGNQAARVPATMGCAVFEVPKGASPITIFTLDPERFIAVNDGVMLALPPLGDVYERLGERLAGTGRCTLRLNTSVLGVRDIDNKSRSATVSSKSESGAVTDDVYDAVIIAAQAEDAARMLPEKHRARSALKRAKYYTDITVSHRDTAHMKSHFGLSQQVTYYMHNRTRHDMDMGFYLNRYQEHLGGTEAPPVYQSLYLDIPKSDQDQKHAESGTPGINPQLVDRVDEWRQVGHTTSHLIGCVAAMGKNQGPVVFFAGSYLLVNSHEVAFMTGIRAAQRCLATKEFPEKEFGPPGVGWQEYVKALG